MNEDTMAGVSEDKIAKLYKSLIDNPNRELSPIFSFEKGYVPEIVEELEVTPETSGELLEMLASKGILDKKFMDVMVLCPHCRSFKIKETFQCFNCSGNKLDKGAALQHYKCEHMGFEREFIDHKCPGCSKELRQIGVDYRKVGTYYRCTDCNEFFGEPNIRYRCLDCKEFFNLGESVWKPVYSYKPNPSKLDELKGSMVTLSSISEHLATNGYDTSPPNIEGRSKVRHTFDMIGIKNGTSVVADMNVNKKGVSSEPVLTFYAKMLDVSPTEKFFIAVPRLTDDARNLATMYGIEVVEARDEGEMLINFISEFRG